LNTTTLEYGLVVLMGFFDNVVTPKLFHLSHRQGRIEEMRWRELEETHERAAKLRSNGLASRTSTGVKPAVKLRY